MTMNDEIEGIYEIKRINPKIQWIIFSVIMLVAVLFCMSLIGKGEYRLNYCEEKYQEEGIYTENKIIVFVMDWEMPFKLTTQEEGKKQLGYACCLVRKDQETVSRKRDCNYFLDYKPPTFTEKILAFLKKFK